MEKRENDMFINLMVNPTFSLEDFSKVGLTSDNTSIQTKDVYLLSDKIKANPLFQDDSGNFDQSKFDKVYEIALNQMEGLSQKQFAEDVAEDWKMYRNDIFAPEERRKSAEEPEFEIKRILNPFRQKIGFIHTGIKEDPTMSIREIAQSQGYWDKEKGEWHDSANDSGWWANWINPKVYATWDENGEHTDPITGETVQHSKGEYKLNQNGTFYTEELNGRDLHDKEVVSAFDTITTDGSFWNKIDFLDSDDIEKSVGGSLMRAVAQIAPAFIPGVGQWYVGSRVLLSASEIIPAVVNSIGGVTGLGNNPVTNWLEGVNKALTFSSSDYSGGSLGYDDMYTKEGHGFSFENTIKMVADVFTQLAELRWLFEKGTSLFSGVNSKVLTDPAKREEWINNYASKINEDLFSQVGANRLKGKGMANIMSMHHLNEANKIKMAEAALKEKTDYGTKIAEKLSQMYMVGITTASSFNEAKNAGASDFEAALFTAGYSLGEWGILSTDLGKWILPELKQERMSHKNMINVLSKFRDLAEKDALKKGKEQAKRSLGKKLLDYGKSLVTGDYSDSVLASTSKTMISQMSSEAVEEVSEELLLDLSKVAFNVTEAALGGKARFKDAFDNVLERYGMSAIGGAIGGGIASVQSGAYKMYKQNKNLTIDGAFKLLVDAVKEGKSEELIEIANGMTLGDRVHSFLKDSEGNYLKADLNTPSQDAQIKLLLVQQIKTVEDILKTNGADIDRETLLDSLADVSGLRENIRYLNLRESPVLGMYVLDFNETINNLAAHEYELRLLEKPVSDLKSENNKHLEDNKEKIDELKELIKLDKKKLEQYKNGEMKNEFIKDTLFVLENHISNAFAPTSFLRFALDVTGKKWENISEPERQDLEKLYIEKRGEIREAIHEGRVVYEQMSKVLGKTLETHANTYFEKLDVDVKKDLTVEDKSLEGYLLNRQSQNIGAQPLQIIDLVEGSFDPKTKYGVDSFILEFLIKNINDTYLNDLLKNLQKQAGSLAEVFNNGVLSSGKAKIEEFLNTLSNEDARTFLKAFVETYNKLKLLEKIKNLDDIIAEVAASGGDPNALKNLRQQIVDILENYEDTFSDLDEADWAVLGGSENFITDLNYFYKKGDDGSLAIETDGPDKGKYIVDAKNLSERAEELDNDILNHYGNLKNDIYGSLILLKDKIKEIFKKQKYLSPTTKNYLLNFINSSFEGSNAETLEELKTSINGIDNSPIFELLNNAIASLKDEKINVSGILNDLSSQLQTFARLAQLGDFSYNEETASQIARIEDLIDIVAAVIEGARTEIDLDLSLINGFNATFNEINQIEFDRSDSEKTKKNKEGLEVTPLPTIDAKVADILLYELSKIKRDLQYYKRIFEINSNQSLNEQNEINVRTVHLILKNLRRFIVSIKDNDDWEEKEDLIDAVNNAVLINDTETNKRTKLSLEELEKIFEEELNIKRAIFKFFNNENNKKALEDKNKFVKLFKDFDLLNSDHNLLLNINTAFQPDSEFLFYLATFASVNPDGLYNDYKKAVGDKYAPIRALEDSILRAYAFILNHGSIEKFILGYNELYKLQLDTERLDPNSPFKNWAKYDTDKFITSSRQFFIDGIAGAGKTSAVFTTLRKMLEDNHKELLEKVIFVSNTELNAKNMAELAGFQNCKTMSKADYMKYISTNYRPFKTKGDGSGRLEVDMSRLAEDEETGISRYKDVSINKALETPTLVIIDEATSMSQLDALLNDDWLREKNCVAILAGDFNQITTSGSTEIDKGTVFLIDLNVGNYMHNWKIGSCIRGNNGLVVLNNNLLLTSWKEIAKSLTDNKPLAAPYVFSYHEKDDVLYGTKILKRDEDIDNIKNQITRLLDTIIEYNSDNPGAFEKLNYIGDDEAINTDGINKEIYNFLKLINASGKYKDLVYFTTSGASQGQEGLYYVINFASPSKPGTPGQVNLTRQALEINETSLRTLYTAISRAKLGTLIIDSDHYGTLVFDSVDVGKKTDKSLSKEAIKNFSDKRKSVIEKAIDSEAGTTYVPENKPTPPVVPPNPVVEPPAPEDEDEGNKPVITIENDPTKVLKSLRMLLHTSTVHNTGGFYIDSSGERVNTLSEASLFCLGNHSDIRIDSMNGLVKLYENNFINGLPYDASKISTTEIDGVKYKTLEKDVASQLLKILEQIRAISSEYDFRSTDGIRGAEDIIKSFFSISTLVHLAYKSNNSPGKVEEKVNTDGNTNWFRFYEDLENERLIGIINTSSEEKIYRPLNKYFEIVFTDSEGKSILEVPFAKLTSPLTLVNCLGMGFDTDPQIIAAVTRSRVDGNISIEKLYTELTSLSGLSPAAEMFTKILAIYIDGSNHIVFLDLEGSRPVVKMDKEPSMGIIFPSKKGDKRTRGAYQLYDHVYAYNGEPVLLSIYKDMLPGRSMSEIYTLVNLNGKNVTTKDGGRTLIEPGKPFIFVSDSSDIESISLKDLVQMYVELESGNGPKHISLLYVTPPSSSFEDYLINIEKAISKNNSKKAFDKELGTPFTLYKLLKDLALNDEAWDEIVTDYIGEKRPDTGYEDNDVSPRKSKEDAYNRLQTIRNFIKKLAELEVNDKKAFYSAIEMPATMDNALKLIDRSLISYVSTNGRSKVLFPTDNDSSFRQWCTTEFHKLMLTKTPLLISSLGNKFERGVDDKGNLKDWALQRLEILKKATNWKDVLYHSGILVGSQRIVKLTSPDGSDSEHIFCPNRVDQNSIKGYTIQGKGYKTNGRAEGAPIVMDVASLINFLYNLQIKDKREHDEHCVRKRSLAEFFNNIDTNKLLNGILYNIIGTSSVNKGYANALTNLGIKGIGMNDELEEELKNIILEEITKLGIEIKNPKDLGKISTNKIITNRLTVAIFNHFKKKGFSKLPLIMAKTTGKRGSYKRKTVFDKGEFMISKDGKSIYFIFENKNEIHELNSEVEKGIQEFPVDLKNTEVRDYLYANNQRAKEIIDELNKKRIALNLSPDYNQLPYFREFLSDMGYKPTGDIEEDRRALKELLYNTLKKNSSKNYNLLVELISKAFPNREAALINKFSIETLYNELKNVEEVSQLDTIMNSLYNSMTVYSLIEDVISLFINNASDNDLGLKGAPKPVAGLGLWDYISLTIKNLINNPDFAIRDEGGQIKFNTEESENTQTLKYNWFKKLSLSDKFYNIISEKEGEIFNKPEDILSSLRKESGRKNKSIKFLPRAKTLAILILELGKRNSEYAQNLRDVLNNFPDDYKKITAAIIGYINPPENWDDDWENSINNKNLLEIIEMALNSFYNNFNMVQFENAYNKALTDDNNQCNGI